MKSIIMQPESVAAILAGRKTQTRRTHTKARYAVGDVIYVREKYAYTFVDAKLHVQFLDSSVKQAQIPKSAYTIHKWRSAFYMPAAAARLFLEITGVRQERLQDITKADVKAEGIELSNPNDFYDEYWIGREQLCFARTWNEINEHRGYPWADNREVFVYTFKISNPERK